MLWFSISTPIIQGMSSGMNFIKIPTVCEHQPVCLLHEHLSNQRLALEHALFDLPNDIPSVILAYENDPATPSAHPTGPAEPMDEVDGRVWHIVQDDMPDCQGVDAS